MSKPTQEPIYRILFTQQEDIKTVYSRYICEDSLMGFIEADSLLNYDPTVKFPELDPTQVQRCYIPLHAIIRIDELIPETAFKKSNQGADNVSCLPHAFKKSTKATI